MSDTTFKTQFTDAILGILEESFDHATGLYLDEGASLFETLATITAEEASKPVSATCASLAAQVEHVSFLLNFTLESAKGRQPDEDWGRIWRTVREVTPDEWEASNQRLRAAHEQIVALVKGYQTWEFDGAISGAMVMLVHTAYHIGEIRQALCTLKG
jgi:hypothetical protein